MGESKIKNDEVWGLKKKKNLHVSKVANKMQNQRVSLFFYINDQSGLEPSTEHANINTFNGFMGDFNLENTFFI